MMILPILLPLLAGAAMVLLGEQRRRVKAALGVASVLAVLGVAVLLLWRADAVDGMAGVYRLGDWPAPFGIVLVVDRLSAMMVLLASILALAALVFSLANWHRAGPHFHPLIANSLVHNLAGICVHDEVIGVNRTRHYRLTKAGVSIDDGLSPSSAYWICGKHHSGGR